jgi:acetolactate synthase-1/2/3 large subunit
MKLSDFVAQRIFELKIKHVFMVTGGGAMHLNHSFGTHPGIEVVYNHHEQACSIAAESYYRVNNELAVCNVTSGPGGTNAITGVHGAFVDSIGMLVVSGQVKYETTVKSTKISLRQYGDQELDIVNLVKPITKYSVMITDPLDIKYELEKAIYLAKNGRPGPCWIDIPIDIQSANINPDELKSFLPNPSIVNKNLLNDINFVYKKIEESKRPIIYAGNGINLSGNRKNFKKLINKLKIPVVTGFNAHDLIESTNHYFVGRPGTIGDRAGNFAVQNSDLLIVMGSRLNIRQISYNWKSFAPRAYIIWVDVDPAELEKPNIKPDYPITADLKDFIPKMLESEIIISSKNDWINWCKVRCLKYPVVISDYWKSDSINPYCFFSKFWDCLSEEVTIVAGNATACIASFQTARIKYGQRLWSNSGSAMMGYDLPAAIGAYKGTKKNNQLICLAGDGSIMMNLQELQTISSNKMNIKIFLINNSGYLSISQTHKNFFNGIEIGSGPESGIKFPSFQKIANAFDINYVSCKTHKELDFKILKTLTSKDATLCEVFIDKSIPFAPKITSKKNADGTITSASLEDMSPFLSEEELKSNMLI